MTPVTVDAPEVGWRPGEVTLKYYFGEFLLRMQVWPGEVWQDPLVHELPELAQLADATGWEVSRATKARYIQALPTGTPLPRVTTRGDIIRYVPRVYMHATARLDSQANYWATFSSKSRSTIRRKVRRLRDSFGRDFRFEVCRTPAEVSAFHGLARELSSRTYQERLFDAGLPDSKEYRDRIATLAARDEFLGFLILCGDRPVAYMACPVVKGVVFYEFVGYDREYASLSPGTVLLVLVLEHLFAEGKYRAFDFTAGEAEHKRAFASDLQPCSDVYYLRRGLSATFLIRSHQLVSWLSSCAAKVAGRVGMKARLKRYFRARAVGVGDATD